jgi:hypothetical protein
MRRTPEILYAFVPMREINSQEGPPSVKCSAPFKFGRLFVGFSRMAQELLRAAILISIDDCS